MKTISTTAKELQATLGAMHPIESEYFWNNESDRVFYCDGDKDTCINAAVEEQVDLNSLTLYWVKDDKMYYIISD